MANNTYQRCLGGSLAILCLGFAALWLAQPGSADAQEKTTKLSDAEIIRLLPGDWMMKTSLKELIPELKEPLGDVKITITVGYKKDGTFKAAILSVTDTVSTTETFEGKWKVAEGVLEKTLTKVNSPSNPKLKPGETSKERVIAITSMKLSVVDLEKKAKRKQKSMTFKRVKE